ncbi:MAG: hypothetical protein IMX00_09200 [Limnochordales bacterium]|nr:hypothetical protein [Limnochordales bacterium]
MTRKFWLVALPCLVLTVLLPFVSALVIPGVVVAPAAWAAVNRAVSPPLGDVAAFSKNSASAVILLLLPGVTWSDLVSPAAASAWEWLWPQAVVGLMNSRSGSGFDPAAGYMTLGAGARALRLPPGSGTVYQREESLAGMTAEEWYRLWTGRDPAEGAILFPGIEAVQSVHRRADHPVTPGALGKWLRAQGLSVAAFGNADLPEGYWRPVALVVMDERGVIPRGRVDAGILSSDHDQPGGRGLDELQLGSLVAAELQAGTDLIAVEWSDLERLERGAGGDGQLFAPGRQESLRWHELARAGKWARMWWERWQVAAGRPLTLVVLSPYPGREAIRRGELLTPVIVYREGGQPGLLVSPTTRWRGIVANLDVAPSLARILAGDREMTAVTGRRWTEVRDRQSASDPEWAVREIRNLAQRTAGVSYTRPGVLRGYVLAQIITSLSLLVLLLAASSRRLPRGRLLNVAGRLLALFVVTLVIVPAALPLTTSLHSRGVGATLAGALGGSLLAALVLLLVVRRPYRAVLLVAAAVTAGLIADVLTGSTFMRRSVLGYDPAVGARYYGIGNEYMGVLVGASTLVGTAGLDWLARSVSRARPAQGIAGLRGALLLPASVGIVTTLVIALPFWGANFGGALTAAAALAVALLGAREEAANTSPGPQSPSPAPPRGWSLSGRHWVWALLALVAVVAGLAVIDTLQPISVRSHVGLLVGAIREDGQAVLWQTIDRKLATNIKIMRYSIWTWGFAIGLVTLTLLFLRPTPGFHRLLADRPYLARGMMASAIASIVAFAANDSGVVCAATTLLFPASALLLLGLESVRSQAAFTIR